MKTSVEVASAIRLGEAFFCLSCEVVTNCVDICPACGNRKLWPLENWLGNVHGHERSRVNAEIPVVAPEKVSDSPSRKHSWEMLRLPVFKS
jgi:hypothetical protein